MILVCGATGELGGRIVRGLRAGGVPVRALVRPQSDGGDLGALGVEPTTGDFRDPESLGRAVAGVETVVSTVTVITRALAGETGADFQRVDVAGHRALIAAAEAAGAQRFVFVSAAGMRQPPTANTPLGLGKIATEDRLVASTLREVILRPDQFQEVWLSPVAQFDWRARKVVIFGKGETPVRYVAVDDVAAATVRLAVMDEPPRLVEFGGPDALTRKQAVEVFERAWERRSGGGTSRGRRCGSAPAAYAAFGPGWRPSWARRSARTSTRRRGTTGRCATSASSHAPSSSTRNRSRASSACRGPGPRPGCRRC